MPKVLLLSTASDPGQTAGLVSLLETRRAANVRNLRLHANIGSCLLRSLPTVRSAIAESEIVHAFGARALATAVLARAGAIVYTPTHWPNRAAIAWLRAAMAYRSIDIAGESDTLRRALVTRGVSADRCHLVRPGVSLGGM
ncbi:MAG: hypothetical protein ACTHM6_12185, partial [Tepidisphaeraceae bacterium]